MMTRFLVLRSDVFSLFHLIATLDTVTNTALLKFVFSKSWIISLKELFQTSASSQDAVTVTRFTLLPEITENWLIYENCFRDTVSPEKMC